MYLYKGVISGKKSGWVGGLKKEVQPVAIETSATCPNSYRLFWKYASNTEQLTQPDEHLNTLLSQIFPKAIYHEGDIYENY